LVSFFFFNDDFLSCYIVPPPSSLLRSALELDHVLFLLNPFLDPLFVIPRSPVTQRRTLMRFLAVVTFDLEDLCSSDFSLFPFLLFSLSSMRSCLTPKTFFAPPVRGLTFGLSAPFPLGISFPAQDATPLWGLFYQFFFLFVLFMYSSSTLG